MTSREELGASRRHGSRAPVHILWMTAGLGCDGESVAMTAATSPSLEDLLAGVIPDSPRIVMHNPVLAFENGDAFDTFGNVMFPNVAGDGDDDEFYLATADTDEQYLAGTPD